MIVSRSNPVVVIVTMLMVSLMGCDQKNKDSANTAHLPVPINETVSTVLQSTQTAIATVGKISISMSQIQDRQGIAQSYGYSMDPPTALVTLIKDVMEYEVARRFGIAPTSKDLQSFSLNVDKQTKAADILSSVKHVFDGDVKKYQKMYLSPKLVNQNLHYWFSTNAKLHERERRLMQRVFGLANSGLDFEGLAKKEGLKFVVHDYGNRGVEVPDALQSYLVSEALTSMSKPFRKVLDATNIGDVASTIIESDYDYKIVRLMKKNVADSTTYSTEEMVLAKAPYQLWYNKQAAKVGVNIHSGILRNKILSGFASLPWVQWMVENQHR